MRKVLKVLFLPILAGIEWLLDFHTSPLSPVAERLKILFGRYEIGTTRFIKMNLKGGIVFDVGANIGYYTRLMSSKADHVYAFEPDADNFELLKRNCARYKNITPINMAVSNNIGTTDFFKVPHSTMRHSLISEEGAKKYSVQTISLDVFVKRRHISGVSLIKIDVEGAEHLVFAGMRQLLATDRPIVIYEGTNVDADAITDAGGVANASQVSWWGSYRKVTNLVARDGTYP